MHHLGVTECRGGLTGIATKLARASPTPAATLLLTSSRTKCWRHNFHAIGVDGGLSLLREEGSRAVACLRVTGVVPRYVRAMWIDVSGVVAHCVRGEARVRAEASVRVTPVGKGPTDMLRRVVPMRCPQSEGAIDGKIVQLLQGVSGYRAPRRHVLGGQPAAAMSSWIAAKGVRGARRITGSVNTEVKSTVARVAPDAKASGPPRGPGASGAV